MPFYQNDTGILIILCCSILLTTDQGSAGNFHLTLLVSLSIWLFLFYTYDRDTSEYIKLWLYQLAGIKLWLYQLADHDTSWMIEKPILPPDKCTNHVYMQIAWQIRVLYMVSRFKASCNACCIALGLHYLRYNHFHSTAFPIYIMIQ